MQIGFIWGAIGTLFGFGFIFNTLVSWLEHRGYDEGFTAILVILGVLVTLGGIIVIDYAIIDYYLGVDRNVTAHEIITTLTLGHLAAFAASGFWMTVGSLTRHARRRCRCQQPYRDAETT